MEEAVADRAEPKGCTMGDLMALTLGVAIASSLSWYHTASNTGRIGNRAAPRWYAAAELGFESLQKGCVALTPVILLRRVRFGGPLQPWEFLPIVTAISQVALAISRWPIVGLLSRSLDPPHELQVNLEVLHIWHLSEIAVGSFAALILLSGRRRLAGWSRGLLLAIFWAFVPNLLGYFYQQWANELLIRLKVRLLVGLGSAFLVSCPQLVVAYLPTMIACVDLARPPQARRTWVVRAAGVIGLSMSGLGEFRIMSATILGWRGDWGDSIHLAGRALGLATSFALALRAEPIWRRLLVGSTAEVARATPSR